MVRAGEKAFIDGHQFSEASYAYQVEITERSNEEGRFEIAPTLEDGLIVAVHQTGYAHLESTGFDNQSEIRLTAWAQVKGVLDHAPNAKAGAQVALQLLQKEKARDVPPIEWIVKAQSPTGRTFRFDYLPAGPMSVGRVQRLEHDHAIFIDAEPGEVYEVDLTPEGSAAQGRIRTVSGLDLAKIDFAHPRQVHAVAFCPRGGPSFPEGVRDPELLSFEWLWQNKEEAVPMSQTLHRRYFPTIDAEGRFIFKGLKPGQYEFIVNVHDPLGENVSCGRGVLRAVGSSRFTVPEQSAGAMTVADVELTPFTYPEEGESAPGFEVRTYDNKTLRLSDFSGKILLLDFWASWCSPCMSKMPELVKLHRRFAGDSRFAMVGLSLDWDLEKGKTAAEKHQWPWPVADIGAMGESKIGGAYGIGSIPTMILIDGRGRIISKTQKIETMEKAIKEALETL